MPAIALNPRLSGFACIRCAVVHAVDDFDRGCPRCWGEGFPASVAPVYADEPLQEPAADARGMRRFADALPYREFPTLGEGDTPLVRADRLADALGVERLLVKMENLQPTGSHKDRMSPLVVARALHLGTQGVIAASSGNAGASLAAYAAKAGLAFTIATSPRITPIWRRAIESTGARLVEIDDPLERWTFVGEIVRPGGWLSATNTCLPPVGSNPFGVDGYKTLAYELVDDLPGTAIDTVFVPTARGDLLWGLYAGFRDLCDAGCLSALPRLVAVEPFPRLERVLAGDDYRRTHQGETALVSIAGGTVTYQAVRSLRETGGRAVSIDAAAAYADMRVLAAEGMYLEMAAAAGLTALRQLVNETAERLGTVVLIGTSGGYKDVHGRDAFGPRGTRDAPIMKDIPGRSGPRTSKP